MIRRIWRITPTDKHERGAAYHTANLVHERIVRSWMTVKKRQARLSATTRAWV